MRKVAIVAALILLIIEYLYLSRLNGGEGGIRTPETLSSLHAFQACALNRARPPLRARTCDYASGQPAEPPDRQRRSRLPAERAPRSHAAAGISWSASQ